MKLNGIDVGKILFNGQSISKALINGQNIFNKIVVYDSFNRANSSTTLGTCETGQTWIVEAGTWGIIDNQAYSLANTGTSEAVIDSGISDCIITLSITCIDNSVNGATRLVFRQTNIDNGFNINANNNEYVLTKRIANNLTILSTINKRPLNNDMFQLVLKGSNIKIYINDVLVCDINEAFNQTATRHGFRVYNHNMSSRYDNFKVEAI